MTLASAVLSGNVERVRRELARSGDAPLYEDHDGIPLIEEVTSLALMDNEPAPMVSLLRAGLTPDFIVRKGRGLTLLMQAAYSNASIVSLLIASDAGVNLADSKGWTPLMYASAFDSSVCGADECIVIMRLLMSAGADPTMRNIAGLSAGDIVKRQSVDPETKRSALDVLSLFRGGREGRSGLR